MIQTQPKNRFQILKKISLIFLTVSLVLMTCGTFCYAIDSDAQISCFANGIENESTYGSTYGIYGGCYVNGRGYGEGAISALYDPDTYTVSYTCTRGYEILVILPAETEFTCSAIYTSYDNRADFLNAHSWTTSTKFGFRYDTGAKYDVNATDLPETALFLYVSNPSGNGTNGTFTITFPAPTPLPGVDIAHSLFDFTLNSTNSFVSFLIASPIALIPLALYVLFALFLIVKRTIRGV